MMADWIERLGAACFLIGFACVLGAMVFGAGDGRRWSVWLRGSFQRREDYSAQGWNWYRAGLALALLGFVLIMSSRAA